MSDSCPGQNKNITVVRFSSWLSTQLGLKIIHTFPPRGHSYCQCDRNFGIYGRILKNVEIVENANQYTNIIKNARINPTPFEVISNIALIKDWKSGLNDISKSKPKKLNGKKQFSIQKCVSLFYSKPRMVTTYFEYDGQGNDFEVLNKHGSDTEFEFKTPPKPGVTESKKNDVLLLVK